MMCVSDKLAAAEYIISGTIIFIIASHGSIKERDATDHHFRAALNAIIAFAMSSEFRFRTVLLFRLLYTHTMRDNNYSPSFVTRICNDIVYYHRC